MAPSRQTVMFDVTRQRFRVTVTTAFIRQPKSWESLADSVMKMTQNQATEVRYAASADEISDEPGVVHVVVMELAGAADYAIEIYWAGMCDMPSDTVGMHIACSINADVLVTADDDSPRSWWLLSPNGVLRAVDLDVEELERSNRVVYQIE